MRGLQYQQTKRYSLVEYWYLFTKPRLITVQILVLLLTASLIVNN